VLTAADSYREPVPHEAALDELRRVAGRQLDAQLVELFAGVLDRERQALAEAVDFTRELDFERRVREYAAI
jgi:HD-GYP domain-containing protein (c-di-GMP phosphodiesterase class II)